MAHTSKYVEKPEDQIIRKTYLLERKVGEEEVSKLITFTLTPTRSGNLAVAYRVMNVLNSKTSDRVFCFTLSIRNEEVKSRSEVKKAWTIRLFANEETNGKYTKDDASGYIMNMSSIASSTTPDLAVKQLVDQMMKAIFKHDWIISMGGKVLNNYEFLLDLLEYSFPLGLSEEDSEV